MVNTDAAFLVFLLTLIADLLLCRSPPTPMASFAIENVVMAAMSGGLVKVLDANQSRLDADWLTNTKI